MYEHRLEFHVARMACVLGVSESGYYKWMSRKDSAPTEKEKADQELAKKIHDIYRGSKGSYGSRKITALLNRQCRKPVNHKRVERLMQERGLFSRTYKKYIITTDSRHSEVTAENLIRRDFEAKAPNQKMVSDTTVVLTAQGPLYVAGILDLYGRIPVGMAMSTKNDRHLVMNALDDMLIRGCGREGCIIHSDRGSTYASKEYRELLEKHGLICSMSRKGDCWDNAPMESFWGKMKSEWLKKKYKRMEDAARDIYE